MAKLQVVTQKVERWRGVWNQIKKHKVASAVIGIIGFAWAVDGFIWGHTPLQAIQIAWALVLPVLTPSGLFYFGLLAVWAITAVALISGYHKERVRSLERDRDCNVLGGHLNESRLRLQVVELERDGLKAKVVELQQQQDSMPFQLKLLRAENQEISRERAHVALENLALIAKEKEWAVSIVIGFVDYGDREMADELKAFLEKYSRSWSIATKHQSGDTLRPKMGDSSRIEIASNRGEFTSHFAGRLTWALATGRYQTSYVHHVASEEDSNEIVLTIFPKSKSELANG